MHEDAPPWIFEDTLAESLLDPQEIDDLEGSMANWSPETRSAFRLTHAVRARVAEDVVVAGLAVGRNHYVLLGAGLDTFAWRHARSSTFTVWEVDHPDTQSWKRAALKRAGLTIPSNVHLIPADFSRLHLRDLALPGLATWNWMGVTMYLTRDEVEATLRDICSGTSGTTLVANFLLPIDEMDSIGAAMNANSTLVLNAANEPVLTRYSTVQVESLLQDAGFSSIDLFDKGVLRERYLKGRDDLLLPRSTVIAVARV